MWMDSMWVSMFFLVLEALEQREQTQPRTGLSQLVTYLYGSSLKGEEVKLTSLPLSLASHGEVVRAAQGQLGCAGLRAGAPLLQLRTLPSE